MKSRYAICVGLLFGVVVGNVSHPSARADAQSGIVIDEVVASSLKQTSLIHGSKVIGFSCGPAATGQGTDCFVVAEK